jgi:hypothetical protein
MGSKFKNVQIKYETYKNWPVLSFYEGSHRLFSLGTSKLEYFYSKIEVSKERVDKGAAYFDYMCRWPFKLDKDQVKILLKFEDAIKQFVVK